MTPEQQRIEIAKACGRTGVRIDIIKNVTFKGDDRIIGITSDQGWVPNYLNDLNAMAEAEKMLTPEQLRGPYRDYLVEASRAPHVPIWCASAAQRAEAFLRTLNLWTDSQP